MKLLKYILLGVAGIFGLVFVVALIVALTEVATEDDSRDTSAVVESVQPPEPTEEELVIERYSALIEEHGRERAGELIQAEIKEAFESKTGDVEMLTNASAAAMLQDHERAKRREAAREAELQEKVDAQFSPWDGSHRGLVQTVKRTLNDPGSFEHLETKTMKGTNWPETFIVRMDYTAKNAYGGRVRGFALVEISSETGRIIQVLEEG